MAIYTAYYDASGTEGDRDRPLVVAGLLASVVGWRRLEREWEATLKRFKVPYSHMKEYAHSTGPFKKWKGKDEQRAAFLAALARALRHVRAGRAFRVLPSDFYVVDREYDLSGVMNSPGPLGGPYTVSAGNCIASFEVLRRKKHPRQEFEHVVAKGDQGQPRFDYLMRLEGIIPIIKPHKDPRTGRYLRPLEAADLVAYEIGLRISHLLTGSGRQLRKSLRAIQRSVPLRVKKQTQGTMREMCREHPDLFLRR